VGWTRPGDPADHRTGQRSDVMPFTGRSSPCRA
jgi:hypothetical protein